MFYNEIFSKIEIFSPDVAALMTTLHSTEPHFVRCIVPNTHKQPGKVRQQLEWKYFLLTMMKEIRREYYRISDRCLSPGLSQHSFS